MLKYILIGDSTSGKSSIINRYLHDIYYDNTSSTIGVELGIKNIIKDEKKIKIQLWDLAGQDRYHCVVKAYYRNVNAALVVFDITNRKTFDNLAKWIDELMEFYNDENRPYIMLIGNKIDLEQRCVTNDEIIELIQNKPIDHYLECSAKFNKNINQIFDNIMFNVYSKIKFDENEKNETLKLEQLSKTKFCCY